MNAPTIIIPGIQGTKLTNINKRNFDTVWSGFRKFFDNLYDILLEPDGITDKQKEVIIERQDVEDMAYSEIINFLKNKDYPIYIFGYDWRKSNLDTGKQLLEFVKVVRKKHPGNAKINFVTHSMGCLVFSGFIKMLTDYQQKTFINKVIFTVPPFLGSLEAMFNLVIGKSKLFNSSDDFRKIARTFPAIFELCPVYPGAITFQNGNPFNIYDYGNWQQDSSRDNYIELKKQYEVRLKALKDARQSNDLIFDLGELPEEIRERMLIVAGGGESTMREMKVDSNSDNPINQFHFAKEYQDDHGDGTVHIKSVEIFKDQITSLNVKSRWIEKRLFMDDWHAFFLNNGRVQNIIKRFLENDRSELSSRWYDSVGDGIEKL